MYTRYRAHVGKRYTLDLIRNASSTNAPIREVIFSGTEPLTIEREQRDPLSPRWSTRCTMQIESDIQYAYEHISRDDQKWYVRLFAPGKENEPIFTGVIEQGLYEEQYDQLPYEVTLTATCGLKMLDDYYLDVDSLPLNERLLTPLLEVVKQCLKKARNLDIHFIGEVGEWLATSYIDPSGYRTNEDGERSSKKMGEVLDDILRSLGLVVYLHKNTWRVEEVISKIDKETILFETDERPIYTTPTLSVENRYGSVRINLAQEELDSVARFAPVTLPMKECTPAKPYLDNKPTLHVNHISATPALASKAILPSSIERSRGMQVRFPFQDGEAICVAVPYRPPAGANGITFDIELGFSDIDSPLGDEWDIQILSEMKLADQTGRNTFIALAGHAPWCYYASSLGLTHQYDVKKEEQEELREQKSKTSYLGKTKGGEAFFTSSWAYMTGVTIAQTTDWQMSGRFDHIITNNLPFCRIKRKNLRNGKMHPFSFSVLLPFPNTIDTHTKKRWAFSIENTNTYYPFYPEPSTLLIYVPMRFWQVGKKENKDKKETFEVFTPTQITVGKVSLRYTMREEEEYNDYLLCDKGEEYVREGEEIQLSLTTKIDGLNQKGTLKGWLYNHEGIQLSQVGGMNLVERAARNFFAFYGKTQDRITLRTLARQPYDITKQYRLKGRPGHDYIIVGSRFDVAHEEEELTLFEAPEKATEGIEYDL